MEVKVGRGICRNCNCYIYDENNKINTNKAYCSDKCKREYYLNHSTKRISICKFCNKEFNSPLDSSGRYYQPGYCSEKCRKLANNETLHDKRVCLFCGKEYYREKTIDSFQFCSKECKDNYTEKRMNPICLNCGKQFKQEKIIYGISNKKFCCDRCYWEYYNKNKSYTCPACGKQFIREKINKVCCSEECEKSGWEKKADFRLITCQYCGKEFKRYRNPKTGQFSGTAPKYCSEECQIAGQKKIIFEKYGDDFYAKLFKLAQQSREKYESVTNNSFAKLLDENNISYEREYTLENYIYDFKLKDCSILIEINPTYTHNIYGNHYNHFQYEPKFLTYHLDKTNVANKHNLFCIHVWQWDDWNNIIRLIKDKTESKNDNLIVDISKKIFNPLDFGYNLVNTSKPHKIWSKRDSKEYVLDDNFNEQDMLKQDYLPVYDCGMEVWFK